LSSRARSKDLARFSAPEVKGGGHTGAIVATSLVFVPTAPFLLHARQGHIAKSTEVTAYVSGDMKLDTAKFQTSPPHIPDRATPAQTLSKEIWIQTVGTQHRRLDGSGNSFLRG
jgi:hypothetical protein